MFSIKLIKLLRPFLVFLMLLQQCSGHKRNFQNVSSLQPPMRLGAPTHPISGEHVSLDFYAAVTKVNLAKDNLQTILQNFLENLQRNLTTSPIFSTVVNTVDAMRTQHLIRKLNDLSAFFQNASELAAMFAQEAELFFEITKNESSALLLKLRQVPSAQRFLPMAAKVRLTDYFAEMEFFHVMFSEVIDEAFEYIVDTLRATQQTFIQYADIQSDMLRNWSFKSDEWCCNSYMDFLQQWSAEIFKCAAGAELNIAYDVYAVTELTTKFILRQLEFRIQRLFNCFIYGSYKIHCRFLRHAEKDFEKLFAKLDELQMYFDIKIKRGRIPAYRRRRRRGNASPRTSTNNSAVALNECIPRDFPNAQMLTSLKSCFFPPEFSHA